MRLSASRSCLVAGAKPRRVLPRAGAITSRFESLEKLWRRGDEPTSLCPSRRDSNPCFSLERASPWLVISGTSTPGATTRCHSRRGIVPHFMISPRHHIACDHEGSVPALGGRDPPRRRRAIALEHFGRCSR